MDVFILTAPSLRSRAQSLGVCLSCVVNQRRHTTASSHLSSTTNAHLGTASADSGAKGWRPYLTISLLANRVCRRPVPATASSPADRRPLARRDGTGTGSHGIIGASTAGEGEAGAAAGCRGGDAGRSGPGGRGGRRRARGDMEHTHSTDVVSPPPPPRVYMSVHPEVSESYSDLTSSVFSTTLLPGAASARTASGGGGSPPRSRALPTRRTRPTSSIAWSNATSAAAAWRTGMFYTASARWPPSWRRSTWRRGTRAVPRGGRRAAARGRGRSRAAPRGPRRRGRWGAATPLL